MEARPKRVRNAPKRLSDEQAAEANKPVKKKPAKKRAAAAGVTVGRAEKKSKLNATNSSNISRGKLLKKELAKYGLERRHDSKLCEAFVKGTTTKTVAKVAVIMCRMKYLYEGYCKEFDNLIDETDREIDEVVDELAEQEASDNYCDPCRGYEGYYRGIRGDACSMVTGYSSFGEYKRESADMWRDFPEQWPWLSMHSTLDGH